MKFLLYSLILLAFVTTQAADHPAHRLAQGFIALIGERYGKAAESNMSQDFELVFNKLYSPSCVIISDKKVVVCSRNAFKLRLQDSKVTGGLWRVIDVEYAPHEKDITCCGVKFTWWTEKNGVFDVRATIKTDDGGTCIKLVEETASQIYSPQQVS